MVGYPATPRGAGRAVRDDGNPAGTPVTSVRHSAARLRTAAVGAIVKDREVASVLADYVEREGHAALIIARAEDALAYLSHDRPDAILLDLRLPGMGGVEFLETLARREIRIPVVVMCGTASEADAARCLQLGALDVAAQPHGHQFDLAASALGHTGVAE